MKLADLARAAALAEQLRVADEAIIHLQSTPQKEGVAAGQLIITTMRGGDGILLDLPEVVKFIENRSAELRKMLKAMGAEL